MTANHAIEWTQQHPYLWTGRSDGLPIGTIERGAQFTFIDTTGSEHHGFRTLDAAQNAAAALLSEIAGANSIEMLVLESRTRSGLDAMDVRTL